MRGRYKTSLIPMVPSRIRWKCWETILVGDVWFNMRISEKNFLGGGLIGHVGNDWRGYERYMEDKDLEKGINFFLVWMMNELGDTIMEFGLTFDLAIANTHFKNGSI